jgi:hypothetical protein
VDLHQAKHPGVLKLVLAATTKAHLQMMLNHGNAVPQVLRPHGRNAAMTEEGTTQALPEVLAVLHPGQETVKVVMLMVMTIMAANMVATTERLLAMQHHGNSKVKVRAKAAMGHLQHILVPILLPVMAGMVVSKQWGHLLAWRLV